MNKKSTFALAAAMLAVSACGLQAQSNYSVTINVPAEQNNTMAYIFNRDNNEKIDSVLVTDGVAKFSGKMETPFIGRISVNGKRGPFFIMEPGNITINEGRASGTALNDKMGEYTDRMQAIVKEFRSIDQNDSTQMPRIEALQKEYKAIPVTAYAENKGNALGLYYFLQNIYDLDLAQLDAAVAADQMLAQSKSIASFRKGLVAKSETSEGKHYKDFTINYNGKDEKLSDYVKPGQVTIVDIWASWCGPCIRQVKVIKELYAKYKDQGLNVVGVAVWDEPEATLKGIKSHGIEWPCIINAQSVPTDLYGINGIPCIMVIDQNGTIVSRDKQSQALIDDVDKAMAAFKSQAMAVPAAASADKDTANVIF